MIHITEDKLRDGQIAAVLSDTMLTFNLAFGQTCVRNVSGTATVAASTMQGTFNGHDCSGAPITNGTLSLAIQRIDIAGTWVGESPAPFGAGTWTWRLTQNGSNIGGSVSIDTTNITD